MNFLNPTFILCVAGLLLGTVAQILYWIYTIESSGLVRTPDYSDFAGCINIAYLFSMLILAFMNLTRKETAGHLTFIMLVVHLGAWIVSLLVTVILLAWFDDGRRDDLKKAATSCLCKTMLTALTIWVVS